MGGTLATLGGTLQATESGNLVARPTKCELVATQVDFLGHRLGGGTVRLQDCNVETVKDAPDRQP